MTCKTNKRIFNRFGLCQGGLPGVAKSGQRQQSDQGVAATQPDPAAMRVEEKGTISVLAATNREDFASRLVSVLGARFAIHHHQCSSADADRLLAELYRSRPDILLLDVSMAGHRDERLLGLVRAGFPRLRIILLWKDPSELDVNAIIDHGIQACQRAEDTEVLGRAVNAVLAGEIWLPRWLEQQIVQRLREIVTAGKAPDRSGFDSESAPESSLTPRENEVFELVRSGFTNKEIGRQLGIAEDTVKKHLKQVFRKLGIRRRIQVAMFDTARQR